MSRSDGGCGALRWGWLGAACWFGLLSLAVPAGAQLQASIQPMPTAASVWKMVWTDMESDGQDDLVYLSYDGVLVVQDYATGLVRSFANVGGFPYDLRVVDLDGDGTQEVLAVTSNDDALSVYDFVGGQLQLRGQYSMNPVQPIYSVTAGHLLSPTPGETCPTCLEIAVGGEGPTVTILESTDLSVAKAIRIPGMEVTYPLGGCPSYLTGQDLTQCLLYENRFGSVRSLDAGDVDPGNGREEILVAAENRAFGVLDAQRGLVTQFDDLCRYGDVSCYGSLYIVEARLLNLPQSGRNEIYLGTHDTGSRAHTVYAIDPHPVPPAIRLRWKATVPTGKGLVMPLLAPIDVGRDGSTELAVLSGPNLTVLDPSNGAQLYQNGTSHYFFNEIAASPHSRSDEVLIGSITGADRNVYLATVSGTATEQLAPFTDEDTPGWRDQINSNLTALRSAIVSMQQSGALPDAESLTRRPPSGFLWPWTALTNPTSEFISAVALNQRNFEQIYTGMGFRFPARFAFYESGLGDHTADSAIVNLAATARNQDARHILVVGHGTDPFVDVETAAAWMDAAGDSCIGVLVSELNVAEYYTASAASKATVFDRYVDDFLVPLIDAAAARNKSVYLLMKEDFWVAAPAIADFSSRVFGTPARRAHVVALVEEGPAHPENNLMAEVGLWRSGYLPKWAVNVIGDQLYTFERADYVQSDPHPTLRQLAASASLGSYEFFSQLGNLIATGSAFDQSGSKYRGYGSLPELCNGQSGASQRCINYTDNGLLSMDLLIRLVGLGVIEVPSRDRIVGISPVVWRFDELDQPTTSPPTFYDPGQVFLWASRNFKAPAFIPTRSQWGLFTGFEWPLNPTRSTYANAYILGVPRYEGQFIPRTPYGLPTILPNGYTPSDASWITNEIETDGWRVGANNVVIDANNMAAIETAIEKTFAQGVAALPVRVSGAFGMATKRNSAAGTATYRVTLMDTPYLDPKPIDATINTLDAVVEAHDVIPVDGHPCKDTTTSNAVSVHIDAGSICVVDVQVATPPVPPPPPQCSDGLDNDGDGLIDFPADPGCASPLDPTEYTDSDGDGVPDNLDNCPYEPNPTQSDVGGLGAAPPDGIGDACQCGDVNNNGTVRSSDVTVLKRALVNLSPAFSVGGNAACTAAAIPAACCTGVGTGTCGAGLGAAGLAKCNVGAVSPGIGGCTSSDAIVISRALVGLSPGILQHCDAALP